LFDSLVDFEISSFKTVTRLSTKIGRIESPKVIRATDSSPFLCK